MTMNFMLIFLLTVPLFARTKCEDNELYKKLAHLNCSPKEIHLTFDDGPRSATTPVILEELNKRKIQVTFFVSTTNLEKSEPNRKLVNTVMEKGHFIASHGHEHRNYDHRYGADQRSLSTPFTEAERQEQIEKSDKLLNLATNGKFSKQKQGKFFRFPYGRGAMPSPYEIEVMIQQGMTIEGSDYREKLAYYRLHSPAMNAISQHDYSHMGWNFDSQDSSLGSEISDDATVEKYLTENLTRMCSNRETMLVALFHDIKKLNAKAIGPLIDTAQCMGMKFIGIDETLQNKNQLVSTGVIINKYDLSKDIIAESIADLLKVNRAPANICPPEPDTSEKRGCYSDYLQKEIAHCEGVNSVCIDGKFYARGSSMAHTECGLPLEKPKLDIKGQKCSVPGEAKMIVENNIKCYCQESESKELRWNCYDISEVPARKL